MENMCAFKGCKNKVDDNERCHGCERYVCEEHCLNPSLFGHHDVEDHWTICDVCGEGLDSCVCEE